MPNFVEPSTLPRGKRQEGPPDFPVLCTTQTSCSLTQVCRHVLISTTRVPFGGATVSKSLGLKPKVRGIKHYEPFGICPLLLLTTENHWWSSGSLERTGKRLEAHLQGCPGRRHEQGSGSAWSPPRPPRQTEPRPSRHATSPLGKFHSGQRSKPALVNSVEVPLFPRWRENLDLDLDGTFEMEHSKTWMSRPSLWQQEDCHHECLLGTAAINRTVIPWKQSRTKERFA